MTWFWIGSVSLALGCLLLGAYFLRQEQYARDEHEREVFLKRLTRFEPKRTDGDTSIRFPPDPQRRRTR